ncbi:GNAT family N-acetyltransferase [Formosa algae]|uniref:GNAT family N-acetyltransferase n=1 Tax=Formosa algae TaxID=225843 RepID=UPI000CCDE1B4|nr:GNAT family N-acetyltransferase [Formosa algae]PNW29074.1 N-acetyltransferase [Formosa algae]
MIREMLPTDGPRILDIYNMGLESRNATFETTVPLWSDWDKNHLKHSRFVWDADGVVIGWVALSPVSARVMYQGVVEVSIYLDTSCVQKGIGSLLMNHVIQSSENHGIWTLYSSVFPENEGTLKLHDKFNFRCIGYREKIAKLDGVWRDTLLLERRSSVVGKD